MINGIHSSTTTTISNIHQSPEFISSPEIHGLHMASLHYHPLPSLSQVREGFIGALLPHSPGRRAPQNKHHGDEDHGVTSKSKGRWWHVVTTQWPLGEPTMPTDTRLNDANWQLPTQLALFFCIPLPCQVLFGDVALGFWIQTSKASFQCSFLTKVCRNDCGSH